MEESNDQEKTEEPSAYRLEEMRNKGNVAISRELVTFIMLFCSLALFYVFSLYFYHNFNLYFEWLTHIKIVNHPLTDLKAHYMSVLKETLWFCLKTVGPFFLLLILSAIASYMIQIGPLFAPDVLSINYERINPIKGLQRIFSMRLIVELLKIMGKITLVVVLTFFFVKQNVNYLKGLYFLDFFQSVYLSHSLILKCLLFNVLGFVVVAMGDFFWERYSYKKKLQQSRREIREEQKEREGNPEIRQRIRALQREFSTRKMISDVPKSDAIITNPTHYSVAIQYDRNKMMAPKVVAKGLDHLALKIRTIAADNNIPLIENPPLARGLYKTVKVGDVIPKDYYKIIAEILAFVYKKKNKIPIEFSEMNTINNLNEINKINKTDVNPTP